MATVGRNIGASPMDAARWQRFQYDLSRVLAEMGLVVFRGSGPGMCDDSDEDAFTVIASIASDDRDAIDWAPLAALAAHYEQDAIAVTAGGTHFVRAPRHTGSALVGVLRGWCATTPRAEADALLDASL